MGTILVDPLWPILSVVAVKSMLRQPVGHSSCLLSGEASHNENLVPFGNLQSGDCA